MPIDMLLMLAVQVLRVGDSDWPMIRPQPWSRWLFLRKRLVQHLCEPDASVIAPLTDDRQELREISLAELGSGLDPLLGCRVLVRHASRQQGFRRPVLHRPIRRGVRALERWEHREFLEPVVLARAYPCDDAAVP